MSHETLANMQCKNQDSCKNYNPHPKHDYCLDDQCPMNDYNNYDPKKKKKNHNYAKGLMAGYISCGFILMIMSLFPVVMGGNVVSLYFLVGAELVIFPIVVLLIIKLLDNSFEKELVNT